MCWSRSQCFFHDAKFLFKHLRCRYLACLFIYLYILLFFVKNRPLPSFKWIKTSNYTHGYIRATVDFNVGPKPIDVTGYHARTLNDKRFP